MADVHVEEVAALAEKLSPLQTVQLIERLTAKLELALQHAEQPTTPKRSLLGLVADLGPAPSAEDIDEARREMWRNFPREDIL
jgi:hypothetical protein